MVIIVEKIDTFWTEHHISEKISYKATGNPNIARSTNLVALKAVINLLIFKSKIIPWTNLESRCGILIAFLESC